MDPDFLTRLIACTAANTLLALGVLLTGRAPAPLGLRRVAATSLLVIVAAGLEMAWLQTHRLTAFGIMNLTFQGLTVTLPVAGLAVLAARALGRPVTRAALLVALLAVPALPLGLYAQFVGPYDVRLERARVPVAVERAGQESLVIAVLADVQATTIEEHHRRAVADLMAAEPDVILIPGDLYQGPVEQFEANAAGFHELLATLHAPGGVWVVPGNADVPHLIEPTLAGSDAVLLRDEQVTVTVRDRTLTIFGLDEVAHAGLADWRADDRRIGHVLTDFLAAPGDDLRILLAHRPRAVLDLPPDSRCDLVVAGHTHGGQVALPVFGPPIVLSPLPRTIAAGGLHAVDGNPLYISRGLGLERLQAPRIRLGAPPEVTLLTLGDEPAATPSGP